jgi:acyl-CoA thioester hydrolase
MPAHAGLYINVEGKPAVDVRFRVRFHETDAMGVVHHAAYITWFEEGRSEYTRVAGFPYSRMSDEGVNLAVIDLAARYLRPARYDDEVIVTTCLEETSSRRLTFTYQVCRLPDRATLATGSTSLVSVDAAGHVMRLPDAVLATYRKAGRG